MPHRRGHPVGSLSGDDEARAVEDATDPGYALEFVLARLRVSAGRAAADLFAAANAHVAAHGGQDSWTLAALEAVEALSDLATHGVRLGDVLPPPDGGDR